MHGLGNAPLQIVQFFRNPVMRGQRERHLFQNGLIDLTPFGITIRGLLIIGTCLAE